jgi:hypothetical protein
MGLGVLWDVPVLPRIKLGPVQRHDLSSACSLEQCPILADAFIQENVIISFKYDLNYSLYQRLPWAHVFIYTKTSFAWRLRGEWVSLQGASG